MFSQVGVLIFEEEQGERANGPCLFKLVEWLCEWQLIWLQMSSKRLWKLGIHTGICSLTVLFRYRGQLKITVNTEWPAMWTQFYTCSLLIGGDIPSAVPHSSEHLQVTLIVKKKKIKWNKTDMKADKRCLERPSGGSQRALGLVWFGTDRSDNRYWCKVSQFQCVSGCLVVSDWCL